MGEGDRNLRRAGLVLALRSCQLFAGLPAADLEEIAGQVTPKLLQKGEYLFREGDPSPGFYVVQRGAINVHRVTAAGREQVLSVFRPGDSFAEASLAGGAGYPADARAESPSQVLMVTKEGFLALVARRPELALRMLGSMSAHLRVLVRQLEDLTLKDVETRLAAWLARRCPAGHAGPVVVRIEGTKRMLAAELGTVSETFSRTLARFRERGFLSVRGAEITIRDPAAIRALAAGG
jgi:CRP/FNR family transcriptional regulator, dissimilatory nitrate respiration regulator